MSGMNPHLAEMYNTHGAGDALSEEQTKVASLELFAKTAAAEGIDLSLLPPEDQNTLYSQFVEKLAQEDEESEDEGNGNGKPPPEKKDDEEDKEAAARAELAQTQDWQQKVAEADFLGRQMAHAFWSESREIEKEAAGIKDTAGKALQAVKGVGGKAGERVGAAAESVGGKIRKAVGKGGSAHPLDAASEAKKSRRLGYAAMGAGAGAAAAGGAAAAKGGKEKKGSALDEIAAEQAVKIAAEAGWDTDEAVDRLKAVITLGGPNIENTKVAHVADDYDASVNVRGLEFLEAAGYPVDWEQVFSSES